ncbi:MAG: hypothetical protein EOO77_12780 [Oxalobacteraceae bacterium]|nr:MAG: hypothetical protein EOO77_12780 [Oxalobacteraceae bacterium]
MIVFIDGHRQAYGGEPICKARQSPRQPTTPMRRDGLAWGRCQPALGVAPMAEFRRVFESNFGVYGVRKV